MSQDPLNEASRLAERAAEPAVIGNVVTGTAGWTDKTLVQSGLFYPRGVSSARGRLEHYAKHFAMVEVDATYYSLLPRRTSERWLEWTPETFRFDIKAFPVLTGHPIDTSRLPKDLSAALREAEIDGPRIYADELPAELASELENRFMDFVEPLASAGRLGCVMLQFPPWFEATRGNARRIESVVERWGDVPFAVEFRHKSWLEPERRQRVFDLLERLRVSYVAVDEPDVAIGGLPRVTSVTNTDLAIVRFHGQNAKGWREGASVHERFDYLYAEAELRSWVEPIHELAREAVSVHAVFNNCVRNYAVVNAKGLSVLLKKP